MRISFDSILCALLLAASVSTTNAEDHYEEDHHDIGGFEDWVKILAPQTLTKLVVARGQGAHVHTKEGRPTGVAHAMETPSIATGVVPGRPDFVKGEQAYASAVEANFNQPRDTEVLSSNDHGKVRRRRGVSRTGKPKTKGSKINNAAPFQDDGGDPGD